MALKFGGLGVTPSHRGQPTTVLSLSAGQSELIPAGSWQVGTGLYTELQEFDPIPGIWRNIGNDAGSTNRYVESDGVNFRVANQTGCCVGALVTTAGAGYTSVPVVADNGGTATYQAIVGGAVSTAATIANGGTGYQYPPQILISSPAAPGVQATATCTISAGAINSVTITNQGAGYTNAPGFSVVNDPRDTIGQNGRITGSTTGAGTVTAVVVTNHGTPVTSVPTLTFTGGSPTTSAAATAIMCWTITAMTVTSAGSGYVGSVLVTGLGGFPATLPSYTNPYIQSGLVRQRAALIGAGLTAGAISTGGNTIYDGGIFPGTPTGYVSGFATGSAAQPGFTMGGVTDTVLLIAA